MRLRLFLVGVLLTFSRPALARDVLFDHVFTQPTGAPAKISTLVSGTDKAVLILFWAGWCVPCKEELALVLEHRDDLDSFEIVAVNIDDESTWPQAQATLSSLSWSLLSLRDVGGSIFYQTRSTGILPYAVLLNSEGTLLKTFEKVDDEAIAQLKELAQISKPEVTQSWELKERLRYRYLKANESDRREAVTQFAGIQFNSVSWTVRAEHRLLGQFAKSSSGQSEKWEDEIGRSFVQWKDQGNSLTAGDSDVVWMGGRLFLVRDIKNANDDSCLRGANYSYFGSGWSLNAVGGEIKTQLFGDQIDPSQDISLSLPREVAGGVLGSTHASIGSDRDVNVTVGYVDYSRAKESEIGFPVSAEDKRLGASLYLGASRNGFQFDVVRYGWKSAVAAGSVADGNLTEVSGWLSYGSTRWPLTYQEFHSLPPRSTPPVLTEELGTPIDTKRKQSLKVYPRFDLSGVLQHWIVNPYWLYEKSMVPSALAGQSSYALNIQNPQQKMKFQVLHQDSVNDFSQRAADWIYSTNFPLGSVLTGQLIYKLRQDSSEGGSSIGALAGLNISELAKLTSWGLLQVSLSYTKQDGYYLGQSGVARNELNSVQLSWTHDLFDIRAALGQEPGGVVCANGFCTQRAPLNGFAFDAGLTFRM